jgi:hypothetical protein
MSIKKFLKPDWRKIVLIIILLIISSLSTWGIIISQTNLGFPFAYFKGHFGELSEFDIIALFLNIIFYYLFSCFVIWIYSKVKKK